MEIDAQAIGVAALVIAVLGLILRVSARVENTVKTITEDMHELKGDVQHMVTELRDTLNQISTSLSDVRERTAFLEGRRKGEG